MHYNEQFNRQPQQAGNRKLIKRPNETPGLESFRSTTPSHYPPMDNVGYGQNYTENPYSSQNMQYPSSNSMAINPGYGYSNQYDGFPSTQHGGFPSTQHGGFPPTQQGGFPSSHILSDPLVANVAMQYGQSIVASGKQIVDKELEKYVAVSKLKYYFAVDTSYVSKKLSIILFPYLHSDWSVKYDQNEPIQPKFEVNAPDLYIPTMAFLTYVLVAGLILGTKYQFNPEKLSIEATNALAWTALEVVVQLITLYVANIQTNLKTYDLIAYSSYKYVGMIIMLLINLILGYTGYIVSLVYFSAAIAFFLMRTLKLQILAEPVAYQQDMYGMSQPTVQQTGLKRRQYFLLFVACSQIILMWWLTWRII